MDCSDFVLAQYVSMPTQTEPRLLGHGQTSEHGEEAEEKLAAAAAEREAAERLAELRREAEAAAAPA